MPDVRGYDGGMLTYVLARVGPDGPGTVEVLGADGAVLAAADVPDPRLRTVVTPDGGASAVLESGLARVRVPWPEGAVAVRGGTRARASGAGAVPVVVGGPAEERLDLLVLGDGYAADELDRFAADVQALVDYLGSIEPYDHYADLLNVWRVDLPSAGAVGHGGVPGDTAFGCTYDCGGVDRLVCCDEDRVVGAIDASLPDADGALVLLDDPEYGGSGGFTYATAYNGPDGVRVAAHELGHSLVGLWDEYSYGIPGDGSGPNCARGSGRWDEWLGVVGVGAFEGCSYTDLVRPTDEGCMMRTLRDGYCPVCREQVILAMHASLGGLVRATDPPAGERVTERITVETKVPAERLAFEWTLDGEVVAEGPTAEVRCSGWDGELALRVADPTGWVRSDPDGLLEDEAGPWIVSADDCSRRGCGCRGTGGGWWVVGLLAARRRRC